MGDEFNITREGLQLQAFSCYISLQLTVHSSQFIIHRLKKKQVNLMIENSPFTHHASRITHYALRFHRLKKKQVNLMIENSPFTHHASRFTLSQIKKSKLI